MTTPDTIEIARAKIAHHQAQIARLEGFISVYEELQKEAAAAEDHTLRVVTVEQVPGQSYTALVSDERFSTTGEILDSARDILLEKARPMLASELFEELLKRGIRISGKSPKGNLTAKFWTRKDLFRVDPETRLWSLVGTGDSENETPPALTEGASRDTGEVAASPDESQEPEKDIFG